MFSRLDTIAEDDSRTDGSLATAKIAWSIAQVKMQTVMHIVSATGLHICLLQFDSEEQTSAYRHLFLVNQIKQSTYNINIIFCNS